MEEMLPSSSLLSSHSHGVDGRNENKISPSPPYQLPTISAPPNLYTFLVSSLVVCTGILGLPRLLSLFKPNSSRPSSPPARQPKTPSPDPYPGRPYDVFLNHRGPDVKKNLASIIYHRLDDKGLRVFLDKEEFQAADGLHSTIQQAISSSSVHVAIFSKGYAESSWCLDELCWMLKSGAKIIPVFYDDVRPSDLRWIAKGKGLYAKAFSRHQKKGRFSSQKIDQWKADLERVSYMYGLELHGGEFQGDCGKLVKCIGDVVLQAVAEKMPQKSPKDAVGLNEGVEDFQKFLQCEAQKSTTHEAVKIVGIVGIGGSGKTTLAQQFYNIQRSSFSASSFLSDVRDTAAQQKLQSLQRQLLKDLLHIDDGNIERGSAIDGRGIIENRLRSSTPRVLIVLDDIDHEKQVENLLVKEVLGQGSLILVTSRDKDPLTKSRADSIYQIKPLNKNHALELFCRHAFEQPRPKMGFEDLAEKFCGKCRGLPLFLQVLGRHLRVIGDNDKDVWKEELEYIPDDVKVILQISYNALREEEKQIFLDVACFFLGRSKSSAIRAWNSSQRRSRTLLKNLENKCLVEVDNNNCLRMHDHLRDFGRDIAEKEPQCRIWHSRQMTNIPEEIKRGREVRGIMAASSFEFFRTSTLKSIFKGIELSTLKFLDIQGDWFPTRFGKQATNLNLMWLRWFDFPHTSIPSWLISMEKLTVLELRSGRLEEWAVCDKQLPLKELIIRDTRLSKISFPEAVWPHLEHLDLCGNRSLVEVEHLPTTLLVLNLDSCINLKRISGSFDLPRLQKMKIYACYGLDELPNLSGLTSLETLEVNCCDLLEDIQGLKHLHKLKNLSISRCSMLRAPNLSGLTSLETLEVDSCSRLQDIQGLKHLHKLKNLSISCCYMLRALPNLLGLTSLETLEVDYCPELQDIRGLKHLHKLKNLSISDCYMLHALPHLSGLTSLETLDAHSCPKLESIQGLEDLGKLQKLSIRVCHGLRELPNLSGLTSLETLEARDCRKLQNIQGLEHLRKLKNLNISFCSKLQTLPNLSGLASLEILDARDCISLQKIRGAEHLLMLEHLNICGCSELDELSTLSGLNSLKTLKAEGCWKLQMIDGLDQLEQLTLLTLSAADGDTAILKSIQHMKKLPSTLLFSAVGAGFNASSFPGLPVSDFSPSGNIGCWKSEMHALTDDGTPCTAFMLCLVVEPSIEETMEVHSALSIRTDTFSLVRESARSFEMHQEPSHRPPLRWIHRLDERMLRTEWVCVAVFSQLEEEPHLTSTFRWRGGFLREMEPTRGCMMRLSKGNGGQVSEIIDKLLANGGCGGCH